MSSSFRDIRLVALLIGWPTYSRFLCRLRSIATHRDHFVRRPSVCLFVRLSVRLSHFPKLCFASDTCIPRNAATIFVVLSICNMQVVSVEIYFMFAGSYFVIAPAPALPLLMCSSLSSSVDKKFYLTLTFQALFKFGYCWQNTLSSDNSCCLFIFPTFVFKLSITSSFLWFLYGWYTLKWSDWFVLFYK